MRLHEDGVASDAVCYNTKGKASNLCCHQLKLYCRYMQYDIHEEIEIAGSGRQSQTAATAFVIFSVGWINLCLLHMAMIEEAPSQTTLSKCSSALCICHAAQSPKATPVPHATEHLLQIFIQPCKVLKVTACASDKDFGVH